MRVIIAGDRTVTDLSIIDKAVKQSGFEIDTVISGHAKGVDQLGEKWATSNGINVKEYAAKWNDLNVPGAIPKKNQWGKTYNATAGLARNEEMAKNADALIAIQPHGPTSGTQHMIKMAKKHKLKIHIYEKPDEDYEYQF